MRRSIYIQFALVGAALLILFYVALFDKQTYIEVPTNINIRTGALTPLDDETRQPASDDEAQEATPVPEGTAEVETGYQPTGTPPGETTREEAETLYR